MTWIMFDNKILEPLTGAFFRLDKIEHYTKATWYDVRYYSCQFKPDFYAESFETEVQAQQRFEELKKELIRKPRLLINTEGTFKEILNGEEI